MRENRYKAAFPTGLYRSSFIWEIRRGGIGKLNSIPTFRPGFVDSETTSPKREKGNYVGQDLHVYELPNGLVLLGEIMDWVESAAFTIALPAGCIHDPSDRLGLANFASEMAQRGCGDHDSREFIESLDRLGADRSSSTTQVHTSYSAATLASNFERVLQLHSDLVQRPHLPEDQLEEARNVCVHEIQALDDDLAQRCIQALKSRTYPAPWGRAPCGCREGIARIGSRDIQQFVGQHYQPQNAVVSVAGKVVWEEVKSAVENCFGDWQGQAEEKLQLQEPPGGYHHIPHDSSQMQIAVAYSSVPYNHADYFRARGAVGVLSDGMSSRLFTEMRENRGLCYTVYAAYHSLRDEGRVMAYAATSTERAQESLNVMLSEIMRLADGIDQNELQRLKARVRSSLIMQQEMSAARAGSMAADWYHLRRVRTLDEVSGIIEALTVESVNEFLRENPPGDFTIVTVGEQPLEVRVGVS